MQAVVGSPPYAAVGMQGGSTTIGTPPRPGDVRQYPRKAPIREYGTTPGQLGAMPPGALVSSPPYAGAGEVLGTHNGIDWSKAQEGGTVATRHARPVARAMAPPMASLARCPLGRCRPW